MAPKRAADTASVQVNVEAEPPLASLLTQRFNTIREFSKELCEPLEVEDYVIQSMADVSPTKWHLAHTSWFFETFVLTPYQQGYRTPNSRYKFLFNSYYNLVGDKHQRDNRGFISRPTVADVAGYRDHVDEHIRLFLDDAEPVLLGKVAPLIEIGLHHEQQHQELIVTDIKHVFSVNPLRPQYLDLPVDRSVDNSGMSRRWKQFDEGVYEIGHKGDGFSYDNEAPRHRVFLEPFALATTLVTNREYLAFIEDNGYKRPEFWLSDGWRAIEEHEWEAPLYWEKNNGQRNVFTLGGTRPLNLNEPVCHVSYYEADAFARWAGLRLPTEAQWEVASSKVAIEGNFVDDRRFHPHASNGNGDAMEQMFGDVWEWTRSQYVAYPGYLPPAGALGEYNGKFMCDQFVLRGGSCATFSDHIRRTYRNFFPAGARWQFMGIRLAKDHEA